eukprot:TRINITY_DN4771_c0_g2_i21.p1 TRINITY_DN4771_c0_g2~~TRINITY_DN4771_c0_g2_i21.p1  ORF type:complete len:387 (+),score=104.13 TRINITY_DN4771_c0_g2_i21:59-1219(+)
MSRTNAAAKQGPTTGTPDRRRDESPAFAKQGSRDLETIYERIRAMEERVSQYNNRDDRAQRGLADRSPPPVHSSNTTTTIIEESNGRSFSTIDRRLQSIENKLDLLLAKSETRGSRGEFDELFGLLRTVIENQRQAETEIYSLRTLIAGGASSVGADKRPIGGGYVTHSARVLESQVGNGPLPERPVESRPAPRRELSEDVKVAAGKDQNDNVYLKYLDEKNRVSQDDDRKRERSPHFSGHDVLDLNRLRPPQDAEDFNLAQSREGGISQSRRIVTTEVVRTETVDDPKKASGQLKSSFVFEDKRRAIDEEIERRIREGNERRKRSINGIDTQKSPEPVDAEFRYSPYSNEKSRSQEINNRLGQERRSREEKITRLTETTTAVTKK